MHLTLIILRLYCAFVPDRLSRAIPRRVSGEEGRSFRACAADVRVMPSASESCDSHFGFVPYTGSLLYNTLTLSSTEACASLCAGSALQGCEAYIFCRTFQEGNLLRLCLLLNSVAEDSDDHSPFPGSCDAGRPCAGTCENENGEVSRLWPDAGVTSCSGLVGKYGKSSCLTSFRDGGNDSLPDISLVRAMCPASCQACASPRVAEQMNKFSGSVSASAAAIYVAKAVAQIEQGCKIEENIVYGNAISGTSMFVWKAVLSADTCSSLCAAKAGCASFIFYKASLGDHDRFDCVAFNDTATDTLRSSTRESDDCCDSGLACAARCVNHNAYVGALMRVKDSGHIGNCEEYVIGEIMSYNATACRDLPMADLIEGLCPLSCYVRQGHQGLDMIETSSSSEEAGNFSPTTVTASVVHLLTTVTTSAASTTLESNDVYKADTAGNAQVLRVSRACGWHGVELLMVQAMVAAHALGVSMIPA